MLEDESLTGQKNFGLLELVEQILGIVQPWDVTHIVSQIEAKKTHFMFGGRCECWDLTSSYRKNLV